MRLILVKPTNATRRLDSTGEVFHGGGHENCTPGGPAPSTKTPDGKHDRYSGTSVESSSPPQEASLLCVSSPAHKRSNGVAPSGVSAQMSQLKAENLTLSQLSDQDWLLLCGQVSGVGRDSAERAGTSVGHPNHDDRCGCLCPDAPQQSEASTFRPQSKLVTVQDCFTNKRSLTLPQYPQPFSQGTQVSATCQVLPQQTNQRDLLKHAANHPLDNFMPRCSGQEDRKEQQPCNHFKLKDSNQATRPYLFNIPLNSVECAENQRQQPQPAVSGEWRELFGKEPILVQQHRDQESHCLMAGDQTCKSSGDPSIILKCRHLPFRPLTTTSRVKRSPTPASNKSVQSFSTSHFSSLENQDVVEGRARQQLSQVQDCLSLLQHLFFMWVIKNNSDI